MTAAIDISIITVTYNRAQLLAAKRDSLLAQTLEPIRFEWVVCINGGDDVAESQQVLSREMPFRLELIVNAINEPITKARNQCAGRAQGHILYLSDDDCLLAERTLQAHLDAQQRQPAVYIGGITFQGAHSQHWRPRRVDYANLNGANTSLPRAAFEQVVGFRELSGYGGEDVLLGYELMQQSITFHPLADAGVTHLGDNPMRAADADKAKSAGRNAAVMGRWYPEIKTRLGVSSRLLALKYQLFCGVLAGLVKAVWCALDQPSYIYERAYFIGAWEEVHAGSPNDIPDNTP
ncbi:MAG: glycosyltransferase [Deinococcota bacterium]